MASKLGGHSLIRDPSSGKWGSFDPRTLQDRGHWLSVWSKVQGRLNQWTHWERAPGFFFYLRGPQLSVVKEIFSTNYLTFAKINCKGNPVNTFLCSLTPCLAPAPLTEVTTLWRYTNLFIIIIILVRGPVRLGVPRAPMQVKTLLARCRLAYVPADASATHCLLLQWNPDWFYLSGTGSWVVPEKGH